MMEPRESLALAEAIGPVCPIELLRPDGTLVFREQATATERAAAEQLVAAFQSPPAALQRLRAARIAQIDARTRGLVESGFTHGGSQFSLSAAAQQNWTALAVKAADLSFPYTVSTQSDGAFALANASELGTFLAAAFAAVESAIAGGRGLKQQVLAATTAEDVAAVVDNR